MTRPRLNKNTAIINPPLVILSFFAIDENSHLGVNQSNALYPNKNNISAIIPVNKLDNTYTDRLIT